MSEACPICGSIASEGARDCPTCHLDVELFAPVRDAAALGRDSDPAYYRTIAELFRTADLLGPVPELAAVDAVAPVLVPELPPGEASRSASGRAEPAVAVPLLALPAVPDLPRGDALRSRADEYLAVAAKLGLELPDLAARARAAEEVGDDAALGAVARELYVHVAGALVSGYDVEGARRNELAGRTVPASVDVELAAVRSSMEAFDLSGAARHLARAREEIGRLSERWASEKILLTECDLLAATLRELGGDPAPALGPLREGSRGEAGSGPELTELVLAQTAVALWTLLEPRFTSELKRLRDLLVERRAAGRDVGPALAKLRLVATEIRRRNFAGTVVAYRQLRAAVGPAGAEPLVVGVPEAERRPA